MRTWEARDPDFARPIAAPLDRCAELLGIDLDEHIRNVIAALQPVGPALGLRTQRDAA